MPESRILIVPFDPRYADDFARLNYQWIEEYFGVEDHDRKVLDDPRREVIDRGGEIFFALIGERVVGTAAMIAAGDDFELAKMAVEPEFRGRGIGDLLLKAAIGFARRSGNRRIWLLSNSRLAAALALYRKHGFVDIPVGNDSPYSRTDVRMELVPEGGR